MPMHLKKRFSHPLRSCEELIDEVGQAGLSPLPPRRWEKSSPNHIEVKAEKR